MNKADLLNLVGKGKVKIGDDTIEVTRSKCAGSDYINITQFAINEHTTDHVFSGNFEEYITDEDCSKLEEAIKNAHDIMVMQAELCKRKPIELHRVEGGDTLENETGRTYVIQKPAKDHFEIYIYSNGEPSHAINCPVTIDGVLHMPVWSWWLGKGCYLIKEG
jgi:hypothetical protein